MFQFHLQFLAALVHCKTELFHFRTATDFILSVPDFRILMAVITLCILEVDTAVILVFHVLQFYKMALTLNEKPKISIAVIKSINKYGKV